MIEGWLASQPRLAAAYAADGCLLHQLGDLPAAKLDLEQALQLDSHDTPGLVELGLVYEAPPAARPSCGALTSGAGRNPQQDDVAGRLKRLKPRGSNGRCRNRKLQYCDRPEGYG